AVARQVVRGRPRRAPPRARRRLPGAGPTSARDRRDDRGNDHPRDGHARRARGGGAPVHRSAARGVGPGRRPEAIPRGTGRRGRACPRRVRHGFPHGDRGAARGDPGLKTLVLEAGRPIDPARDYVEHVPPWAMKFRGFGDRKALERDQFIQRHCYACNEYSGKFFVNDRDNPYTFDPAKPFHWIRGRQVGGKSIMWGRQVYRWSDLDFAANARDGFGVDWPIRYADIAPWYDYVEALIGIPGEAL